MTTNNTNALLPYVPGAYPQASSVASLGQYVTQELKKIKRCIQLLIQVDNAILSTSLTQVATVTNAGAAAAGVPVGGFYTGPSGANPAPVYVRTA